MRHVCGSQSVSLRVSTLSLFAIAGLLAAVAFAHLATPEASQAADEPAAADKPVEGQLWNLTSKPFSLRMRRRDGSAWTEPIKIEPGKYLAIRPSQDNGQNDLEGITGRGNGHVSVEYAELGGHIRLQLPAQNQAGKLMPFWFAVKDSNGFTRLIQAADMEAAKQRQAELQAEPKLSSQELASIKKMLRANWVLFD